MTGRIGKAALALTLSGLAACGTDTPGVNPAPPFDRSTPGAASGGSSGSGGSATGGAAGSSAAAGSGGAAGTAGSGGSGGKAVRSVIVRDPFEGYDANDNLMLDGGFELSGETAGTWGAYAGPMKFGNGAVCRTGLRCGITRPNEPIYGYFVSPKEGAIRVSFRADTGGAACDTIRVVVVDAYGLGGSTLLAMTSETLEADGWCAVSGATPARTYETPLVVIEPSAGKTYIDDVEVRPTVTSHPPKAVPWRMQSQLELIRARARATLRSEPGLRRSIRSGAPWSAGFDPWIR